MKMEFEVYKITEYKDDSVFKTEKVKTIWLDIEARKPKEEAEIAQNHGGDILAPTGKTE